MEMVRKAQHGINEVTASVEEYETETLAVSKSTLKRTKSKADLENYNKKKKKQKLQEDSQVSLDSLQDVMAFGNKLQSQYGPESEENEQMKSELLVKTLY